MKRTISNEKLAHIGIFESNLFRAKSNNKKVSNFSGFYLKLKVLILAPRGEPLTQQSHRQSFPLQLECLLINKKVLNLLVVQEASVTFGVSFRKAHVGFTKT
jgi:hypothetical protein